MKATIVVQFGDSVAKESQFAVVELDGTMNLDADGKEKSQFVPGDEAIFLVHLPEDLFIDRIAATDGMVVAMGGASLERNQEALFTDDEQQQLSYYPAGAVATDWQGTVGTGFEVDGRDISIVGNWPAAVKLAYHVAFNRYKLVPPPLTLAEDESYQVHVVVYVEAK